MRTEIYTELGCTLQEDEGGAFAERFISTEKKMRPAIVAQTPFGRAGVKEWGATGEMEKVNKKEAKVSAERS